MNPPYILPQRPDEQIEIFVVAVRLGIISIVVEINSIRVVALLTIEYAIAIKTPGQVTLNDKSIASFYPNLSIQIFLFN